MPVFALLSRHALAAVEEQLADDGQAAHEHLDAAFTRFEDTQPALAARVSAALSSPLDETALALGYFLTLAVWLGFDSLFGSALGEVTETELTGVEESLVLDEQIRLSDPAEALDSDDVVAMEQPEVLTFVNEHLDAALEANADEVDVDDVHTIYRVVLIEILALSYAVHPPANWQIESAEFSA